MVTLRAWRSNNSIRRQIPTRSPYSRSVTAAMFLGKTACAGGARWLDRWCDSRVAKISGHTSQGMMKVTAIFALFGHSIGSGRGTAAPEQNPPGVLAHVPEKVGTGFPKKDMRHPIRSARQRWQISRDQSGLT